MKCARLISLIKNWYLQVQNEAMAPARMVDFIGQHISNCEECLDDPDVKEEAEKIKEMVLPPSKVPKPKEAKKQIEPEPVVEEKIEVSETEAESPEAENHENDADDEEYAEEGAEVDEDMEI